jgi:uncharacterized protein
VTPGGPEGAASPSNRLAGETSPYLLQHAHNPVDWYPWSEAALEHAREMDLPIFLSIGYAACHWCHVMERESFEDPATAGDLNTWFVAVKVDREERPDLDAVYMDALQQMTGQGGWPMSLFLTPDGRPFFGGTYFPNRRGLGLPSFRDVLSGVAAAWRDRREEVERSATALAAAVRAGQRAPGLHVSLPGAEGSGTANRGSVEAGRSDMLLRTAAAELERSFDSEGGGWGRAPKFPQAMALEFLLREGLRSGDAGAGALAVVRRGLDAMADGGIHDQLGGGFARYATDAVWLVPHFEKMLYDNALLARTYSHAFAVTGEPRYGEVATDTLGFLLRDLRTEQGAFAASLDADTSGHEGATYVWDASEIRTALGEDADLFAAAYGVTAAGNWEGRTILWRIAGDAELARRFSLSAVEVERRLARSRAILLELRGHRPQPARDAKQIAAWNGLAIAALADASWCLGVGHAEYAVAASEAASFLLDSLLDGDGRLRRSWTSGRARDSGTLEDHAHLAEGLLCLYEATFDERWFVAARHLMDVVLQHFADPAGGFFDTADDAESLIARPRGLQDNAIPSGNAMAVGVLLRLGALTGEPQWAAAAEAALLPLLETASRYPTAFPVWLLAQQTLAVGLDEIAVVEAPAGDASGTARSAALLAAARHPFNPWQVLACSGNPDASAIPLLHGRVAIASRPTAYLCRDFACRAPVTEPAGLVDQRTTVRRRRPSEA